MFTSTRSISGYLQVAGDVFILKEPLDSLRTGVDQWPVVGVAVGHQLNPRPLLAFIRALEHSAQRLLHHRVEAAVLAGCQRLGFGEDLFVYAERGAMHNVTLAHDIKLSRCPRARPEWRFDINMSTQ